MTSLRSALHRRISRHQLKEYHDHYSTPSKIHRARMRAGAGRSAAEPMPSPTPAPPHLNPSPPISFPLGGAIGAAMNGGSTGGEVRTIPQAVVDALTGPRAK